MTVFLVGASLSVFMARCAIQCSEEKQRLFLGIMAVFFPLSEAFKQVLLFFVNQRIYDWWYFPFQLCSMPLYLLPLYCILSGRGHHPRTCRLLAAFLTDFGLLGGIFAFADQRGMLYPLFALTFHSYLWHFLMISMGLFLAMKNAGDFRPAAFLPVCGLFLTLTGAATGINIMFHSRGIINMFYLSPYLPMEQVIIKDTVPYIGQTAAHFLYLAVMILGGFLIHVGIWGLHHFSLRK